MMPQGDEQEFYQREFLESLAKKEDLSSLELRLTKEIADKVKEGFQDLRREIREENDRKEQAVANERNLKNALLIALIGVCATLGGGLLRAFFT